MGYSTITKYWANTIRIREKLGMVYFLSFFSYLIAWLRDQFGKLYRSFFISDACSKKFQNVTMAKRKSFASVSMQDDKPFDFLRTLFEGVIAGGTAGVVVGTALYPIDTIKT